MSLSASPPSESGTPPRKAGESLGPYVLVSRLGAGGMGEVWEAVHHGPAGFRKAVALKLLKPGMVTEEEGPRLAREARLGALLQHPNVVATLGLCEVDGSWCVALELVRGPSVAELARASGGRLPPALVVEVGAQVAEGLHHVHTLTVDGVRAGLVHRDVKPANLLVDHTGLVKLADLGISSLAGETGETAGTPGYMAPEQAAGLAEARSDLFALGATLYQLATGVRPFGEGADAQPTTQDVDVALGRAAFLAPVDAHVPGLGAVLRGCLGSAPDDRYPDARALADALAALHTRQAPGPSLPELVERARSGAIDPAPPPSGSRPPGRPRDRFVGRVESLGALENLVRTGTRWIVVTGLGGVGKSRLVAELARRLDPGFAEQLPPVDMAELHDVEGLCGALGRALDVQPDRADPVGELGRALATRGRMLVVLDALEGCHDALGETLGRWRVSAPDVTFLTTSRRTIDVEGAHPFPLEGLPAADAEALFLARAPRPLDDQERAEVAALCAAVDGHPLAVELCAARLRALSAMDLRARFGLQLLRGGGRDQRSLASSLRGSWDLLGPGAQAALGQLCVFETPFRLEAAEAVVDLATVGGGWVGDVLGELVDASLLRLDAVSGRFRLDRLVRAFLQDAVFPLERSRGELRHGAWFAQFGETASLAALNTHGGTERYRALRAEHADIVTACRRALERGDVPVAVGCLKAAGAVWRREGPYAVFAALAAPVAQAAAGGPLHADAQRELGAALRFAGQLDAARRALREALAQCRALGDQRRLAAILNDCGGLELERDRRSAALEAFTEALALARSAGSRNEEGVALANLGLLAGQRGRTEDQDEHYTAALAVFRAIGNLRGEGSVLGNLGLLHLREGRTAYALQHFEIAQLRHRESGNRRSEAMVLGYLGAVHLQAGRAAMAVPPFRAAVALHRAVGNRRFEVLDLASMAVALVRAGDPAAPVVAAEAVGVARDLGIPVALGSALLAQGEVARARAHLPLARAALREAEALLRASGDVESLGDALVGLAHLELPHDPPAAEALLTEATASADALGREPGSPFRAALAALQRAIATARRR